MSVRVQAVPAFIVALLGTPVLLAEPQPDLPPFLEREVPFIMDSGWLVADPALPGPQVVFEAIAHEPDAPWLRVFLQNCVLPGDPARGDSPRLRFTSLLDGASQTLTAETLEQWGQSSAYFNGEAVHVELLMHPGTPAARITIAGLRVGLEPAAADQPSQRSICGPTDDRILSSDPRAGRLMSIGCTGWLIDDANFTFLTAGHCDPARANAVMQFNVPLSTAAGATVAPTPEHQYPVDSSSAQQAAAGPGTDWGYYACFANATTGLTAAQAQGDLHRVAALAPPVSGQNIRITGYGSTSSPISPTWNQVQKTHAGPYFSLSGTTVRYRPDTTGGNSGSPVLDESTGLAIGIHTHAGCNSSDPNTSNQGTAIQYAPLQTALAAPRGLCASGVGPAPANPWLFAFGDLNNNFGPINASTGRFARRFQALAGTHGATYEPATGRFLVVDGRNGLHRLSTTGFIERIGTITGAGVSAAAPVAGLAQRHGELLYGIIQTGGQLVTINPVTAEATPVGAPAGGNIGALEFDQDNGALYGLDDTATGTVLVRISTINGSRVAVGPLGAGITDCNGLAWSHLDGDLYTINAATEQLLRVSRATGAATVVGASFGLFGSAYGLAGMNPESLPPPPVCDADLDGSGAVDSDDLLVYLDRWFAGNLDADADGSGAVDADDILVWLNGFFASLGPC